MHVHVKPTKQANLDPIFGPLDLSDNGDRPHIFWLFSLNYLYDIFVILDDPGHFFGHLVPKARSLITLPTVIFFPIELHS